ncbi:unnamed protein product, partial [Symbiodinium necroappetens]
MNVFALACACACSLAALLSLGLSVLRFARPGKYWRFDSARTTFWEELRPSAIKKPGAAESPHLRATPSGLLKKQKDTKGTTRQKTWTVKDAEYNNDVGQISRTNRVIFVHVPKTGGSTIEQSTLFTDARKHHAVGSHNKAARLRDLAPRFRSFSMVRHPCERFVSAFTYSRNYANPSERRWHRQHVGDRNLTSYVASKDFGGDRFWRFLHFQPQYSFLFFANKTFGVDLLLCQDNWTRSMERLGEYLKPVQLPADMKRKHTRNTTHATCSDLPQKTRQRIEKAYAMDMCLFYPTDA